KIEPVIGHRFPFGTFRFDAFDGYAVTGTGFLAELADEAFGLPGRGIADQLDMPTEPRRDFQCLMGVMDSNSGLEELAQRYPQSDEQALQAGIDFRQKVCPHSSLSIALDNTSVTNDTGIRIFHDKFSRP